MKKLICVMLALLMLLALCACGAESAAQTEPAPAEEAAAEPAETVTELSAAAAEPAEGAPTQSNIPEEPVAAADQPVPDAAGAADLDFHPLGEGIDAGDADAVESAGDLVVGAVELAAGVERGEDDFERGAVLRGVHIDGNAAAFVLDGERAVGVDDDVNLVAVASEGLVDGVIDDFVDEVVVAAFARVADIHGGAFAHGLHAFEDGDVCGCVVALFVRFHIL